MLVIEGLIPFWNPQLLRRMLEMLSEMDDNSIRMAGFFSMISGALLLYVIR